MAYSTSDNYKKVIYSGETINNLSFKYGDEYVEDSSPYISSLKLNNNLLKTTATTFNLDNFVSKTIILETHNYEVKDLNKEFYFELGTLVDNKYEYIPIGYFKIKDNPTTANGKTTYNLYDRSINFDFNYDASKLIEANGGQVTILKILQDICSIAKVELATTDFLNKDKLIGVYDNTITGRTYVSYIAEISCSIATIGRDGKLYLIPIKKENNNAIEIDEEILNNQLTTGDSFKVSRVVYENGIISFSKGDETADTLFINSNNPYISSQKDIDLIYNQIVGFEIYSINTSKMLGNISIDPYDFIKFNLTDENGNITKNIISLGQNEFTFNGVMSQNFKTTINRISKTINTSSNNTNAKYRRLKQEIDTVNGSLKILSEEVSDIEVDTTLTKQVSGNPITIEDAGPYPLENIEIEGKKYQETRSGKNKLKLTDFTTTTANGLTFTNMGDGSIKVNGTSTANTNLYITDFITLDAGIYTLSDGLSNPTSTSYFTFVDVKKEDGTAYDEKNMSTVNLNETRTMDVTVNVKCRIVVRSGQTLNNVIFKPMLEEGSTATEFEQHGVSPSPEYPSKIESVEGVTNLLDKDKVEKHKVYNYGTTGVIPPYGTSTTRCALSPTNAIKVKPNTTYIFKNKSGWIFTIGELADDKTLIQETGWKNDIEYKIITSSTTEYVCFNFGLSSTATITDELFNEYINAIQFEKGTTAHNIVPYGRWLEQKTIGKNLFNPNERKDNVVPSSSSGQDVSVNPSFSSNYIKVNNVAYFKWKAGVFGYLFCYDENYNHLGNKGNTSGKISSTEIASNVKYVRIRFDEAYKEELEIIVSNEDIPYEPYKENIALIDLNKKQLFDASKLEIGNSWNNSVNTKRATLVLEYEPNKYYSIKCSKMDGFEYVSIIETADRSTALSSVNNTKPFETTRVLNTNAKYLCIQLQTTSNFDVSMLDNLELKIYEGVETDDYYRIASVPQTKDTFKDGVLTQKIRKVVLNGSKGTIAKMDTNIFSIDDCITDYFKQLNAVTYTSDMYTPVEQTSTRADFITLAQNYDYCFNFMSGAVYNTLRFKNKDITTVDEFKTLLSENPITIYYVLAEPIEYTLPYEVLELHEGYNYITINDELEPNLNITYLTDSKLNAQFATKAEVKIETGSIKQSVSAEIDELDKKTEASLELKVNKKNLASEINAIADFIKLVSNELVIETDKFKLAQGVMEAVGGKIANFEITENALSFSIVPKMNYTQEDVDKVSKYLIHEITLTDEELELYDVDNDGKILSRDGLLMSYFIKFGITTSTPGKFQITVPGENDAFTSTKIGFFDGAGNLINGFSYNSATFEKLSVASGSVYGEHLLYNDEDGTTSNVDLLDDLETYKYFEVLYELNGGLLKSTGKLPVKIGAFFVLDGVWNTDVGLTLQIQTRKYLINNWQLLTAGDEFWRNMNQPDSSSFAINVDGNSGDQLTIKIHTVLGYK